MAKTYAEAKGRADGPGRLAKKEARITRMYKKDWIKLINEKLNTDIDGLDKCTMSTLEQLHEALIRD